VVFIVSVAACQPVSMDLAKVESVGLQNRVAASLTLREECNRGRMIARHGGEGGAGAQARAELVTT